MPMHYNGFKGTNDSLSYLGLENSEVYWNLTPSELIELTVKNNQGKLTDTGALAIDTGEFTGRSPKDRFIVKDDITADSVDWGLVNLAFDAAKFDQIQAKMQQYVEGKTLFARNCFACSNPEHRLNVRVVTEFPWQNMFASNMFIRPTKAELENFEPDWTVMSIPSFMADAVVDGTRQHNFAIINFTKKLILIGGTAYTGEIKKGIFSVLNFELPSYKGILPMHCSSNVGNNNDTAIFFGLSGTGKTTLSTDENRNLIGDDEHGWADNNVFNFEGGCYAKTIDLSAEKEPQIFSAIRHGAMVENIVFKNNSREVDYTDSSKTQNTRVSYPIHHVDRIQASQMGSAPKNIFFLTADAFGVLPPISKLSSSQAMYHFISGYTAKVAGTEEGVTEPQATFSACFGAPFLPLHPTHYAKMLGAKIDADPNINVWLINTGWTGGSFGVGNRMKLKYTRAMINAALDGSLNLVEFIKEDFFGLSIPTTCPNVDDTVLNPINTWTDKDAYKATANELAHKFNNNFKQFEAKASNAILEAAPVLS